MNIIREPNEVNNGLIMFVYALAHCSIDGRGV